MANSYLGESLNLLDMHSMSSDKTGYSEESVKQLEGDLPYFIKFNSLLKGYGITEENQPRTYGVLQTMWEESGKPEFQTIEEEEANWGILGKLGELTRKVIQPTAKGAPHYESELYRSSSDRGKIVGADMDPKIMIEEMAHGYQFHDKPLLENVLKHSEGGIEAIIGTISGLFSDEYDSPHHIPYTMEWRAHQQISPPMYEKYESALAEDLMNTERAYYGENVAGYEGNNALKYLNNLILHHQDNMGWFKEAGTYGYDEKYKSHKSKEEERRRLGGLIKD